MPRSPKRSLPLKWQTNNVTWICYLCIAVSASCSWLEASNVIWRDANCEPLCAVLVNGERRETKYVVTGEGSETYRKLTLDSTVVNLRTNCCNFANLCIFQTHVYVLFYSYLNEQWPVFFCLSLSCVQPVSQTLCDTVQQHVQNFQRQNHTRTTIHRTTSDPHY